MSHEIMRHDGLALAGNRPAWHGYGNYIPEDMTPTEALVPARLNWPVEVYPLSATTPDGRVIQIDSHVGNFRSIKTGEGTIDLELGIVSKGYVPIGNAELAEFCEALIGADGPKVRVETAGSIQNGKRVWFLLRGEDFSVRNQNDCVIPYLCVSNSHDGTASFRITPTTIRAVCSNTLHMIIPRTEVKDDLTSNVVLGNSAFACRHTSNVKSRLEEAQAALARFGKATTETREVMQTLASKDVTKESLNAFFIEAYQTSYNLIPEKNGTYKTEKEQKSAERSRQKAMSAYGSFSRRFDDESSKFGANAWTALNAFTGLVQHEAKARGKDDVDRVESRINSNLFGLNANRTAESLRTAFRILVG